jgi:alpha-glucosidase
VLLVLIARSETYKLVSPDKKLVLAVEYGSQLRYKLLYKGIAVTDSSSVGMLLSTGEKWGFGDKVIKKSTRGVSDVVKPLMGNFEKISDCYNELTLTFKLGYTVHFRLYNEGMAYRFEGNHSAKDSITIKSETANFRLMDNPSAIFPETANFTAWELSHVLYKSISEIENGKYSITPVLFQNSKQQIKVVIAEADVHDYPGMYIRKGQTGLAGFWAQHPSKIEMGSWGNFVTVVKERDNFVAKTGGNHVFPWRILIVADDDRQLLTNNMVYLLSEPQQIKNTDWIKPGKATWEWWHCAMLEKAPFPSGPKNLSTQLYKYYIDFASENRLEYLLIDAGWSNLFAPNELNPKVDVKEIIRYGKQKNVGIWLWTVASTLIHNPHRYLDSISSWGAAGVKIDFFDRDDQLMMREYDNLAKACADRKLMVDFHGCSKPTGLNRAYPNVLNYEAVRGAECSKWDTSANPDYHLQFIFSRMLAGPLDYTPGSMRNATLKTFKPVDPGLPSTLGTRCHELAMYIVFSNPLVMLSDSPDEYRKYPDILKYLSAVPTTWEDTRVLNAKVGEYAIVAKQKGKTWYVGGMNAWNKRTVTSSLSFLNKGKKYHAEIFQDIDSSNEDANLYVHETLKIERDKPFEINMASGGGFVMVINEE